MGELASAQHQRNFHHVPLTKEFLRFLGLHFKVMGIGPHAETDALNLSLLLSLFKLLFLFFLPVQELPKVHDFADGRLGIRCHFHKVELLLLGHLKPFLESDDPYLLFAFINEADGGGADALINAEEFCDTRGR